MTVRVLQGDCRDLLRTLPAASVHCVVTSPPYFNLRDYGVAGQLGLEATPAEYVATMVEVFREVRRVLRDDGTVWLNLGSSYARDASKGHHKPGDSGKQDYIIQRGGGRASVQMDLGASGGKHANRSHSLPHAPACDNDGTAPQDCSAPDCAYPCPDGGCQGGFRCRRASTSDNSRLTEPAGQPLAPTSRGIESLDCAVASPYASPPAEQASSILASEQSALAASCLEATASAYQKSTPTVSRDSLGSVHTSVCSDDTATTSNPSILNKSDMAASGLACGCGSCGVCWSYLAIPRLKFKAKDLVNIPALVSLALQADGWWVRSDIIWAKRNCMPSSVRDRPTLAHEYLFLLTKSQRYYYDAVAIEEDGEIAAGTRAAKGSAERAKHANGRPPEYAVYTGKRNKRSVWFIATQPFPEAHFATFPPDLVEPCILAGTSEHGCCPACGAPWVRQVERTAIERDDFKGSSFDAGKTRARDGGDRTQSGPRHVSRPTGWLPSCTCPAAPPVPATVLDPFGGALTTSLVANRLGRDAISIELNPDYVAMGARRIEKDAGMFADVQVTPCPAS